MSNAFEKKFVPAGNIAKVAQELKKQNKKIITTNGCFDILHLGHIRYLQEARQMGDKLIVGVNSDASVKKLKGEGRPVNGELSRAEVLAALESVDYVTIFQEDTPVKLLSLIQPNIHVKGGDYTGKELPEKQVVESGGGKIQFVSFTEGHSTTGLLASIKKPPESN